MSSARDPSRLGAVAQIFRFEYMAAAAPGVFISFFLCAGSFDELLAVPVAEGLVVVMCLIFAGLGINAIADREVDSKYATHKNQIPGAIDILGQRNAWMLVSALILVGTLLTIHICFQLGSLVPLALIACLAFFGYGYSLRPLHFKVRGVWWHAIAMMLGTVIAPFGLMAHIFLGEIPLSMWTFIVGFGLVQYGWEFCNQSLDYLEDVEEGLRTPAVRLGIRGATRASLVVALTGMVVEAAAAHWMLLERGLVTSGADRFVVWTAMVAAIILGCSIPLFGVVKMYALARCHPPDVAVPLMPRYCAFARWQASSILGVVVATGLLFWLADRWT